MKKKTLLSSILVMALCLSIIAGSTFALFTDEKELNIAVTSGNVEVDASLSLVSTWSAEAATTFEDKYLVDEYGHTYNHKEQDPYKFVNEGYAEIDASGKLVVHQITPGDKVVAQINVQNTGDVAMIYRYKIVSNNSKLADGMVLTTDVDSADEAVYEATNSYTSAWSEVIPVGNTNYVHVFALELPVYAGDEYQSEDEAQPHGKSDTEQKVEYTITVEAVQGNAVMDEDETPYEPIISVTNRDELQIALNNNQEAGKAYTINVLGDIVGDVTVVQRANVQYTINGNDYTFDGALYINGRSGLYETNINATLTINDFNFQSVDGLTGTDAYINFGVKGNTNTRYVRGITVNGCTFSGDAAYKLVAMRSHDNGDYDLTINKCVVNAGMHSLLQVKNFKSITVNETNAYSKHGINLTNSGALEMNGCEFDIQGYAVRVGEDGGTANTEEKFFNINDCEFTTVNDGGDAAIIVRDSSAFSTVTLTNVTVNTPNGLEEEKIDLFMPEYTTVYEITTNP